MKKILLIIFKIILISVITFFVGIILPLILIYAAIAVGSIGISLGLVLSAILIPSALYGSIVLSLFVYNEILNHKHEET